MGHNPQAVPPSAQAGSSKNGSGFGLAMGIIVFAIVETVICFSFGNALLGGNSDAGLALIGTSFALCLVEAIAAVLLLWKARTDDVLIIAPIAALICGIGLAYTMWNLAVMVVAGTMAMFFFMFVFAIVLIPFFLGIYGAMIFCMWLLGTIWGFLYVLGLFKAHRLSLVKTVIAVVLMCVPVINMVEVVILMVTTRERKN